MVTLLLLVLIFAVDIYTDTRAWQSVRHIRGALIRCTAIGILAIFDWHILLAALAYWGIFDTVTGLIKGYGFPWIGSTSYLDRLQHRYVGLIGVKYAVGVAGVALYLIL